MAIKSSGSLSFSEIVAEFADAKPYSMSEFYRGGPKVPSVNANVPTSGLIRFSNFYNAVNELLQTVTAQASVNAGTLFGGDWGSAVPKRLRIPSGTTIGTLTLPSGMGGSLEVDVEGEVQGLGGSANSGAGGHAIIANQSFTLNVLSGGAVRGGGGGGGVGGTGGQGSYQTTETDNGVQDNRWYAPRDGGTSGYIYGGTNWGGFLFNGQINQTMTSISGGGWTYYRGAYQTQSADYRTYDAYRQRQITHYSSGGAGGAGGRGQGYGQSLAGGSSGSAGGTNAGTGGTGGSGGNWGAGGSTGSTGASGNYTGGSAGSTGGSAGRAVQMLSGSVTVNNSGTINGAY